MMHNPYHMAYLERGIELGAAQACPGDEMFSKLIGACICPPGSKPTGIVGKCELTGDPCSTAADGVKRKFNPVTNMCDPVVAGAGSAIPGFVAPGAVAVRCENWQPDATPYARYKLASGDTYVGLAVTYLFDGGRWKEIWDLNRAQHPSPDKIFVGQTINMPAAGADGYAKHCGATPTQIVKKVFPYVLAGAVVVGGGYVIYRVAKKRRRGG